MYTLFSLYTTANHSWQKEEKRTNRQALIIRKMDKEYFIYLP